MDRLRNRPASQPLQNLHTLSSTYRASTSASLILFLFLFSQIVTAGDLPTQESAGAEEARFQKEETFKKEEKETTRTPQKVEIVIEEEGKGGEKKSVYKGKPFRMNDIRIVGNEQIPTSELQPFVGALFNRDVNLEEIQEAVSKMKQHYRSKGYVSTYIHIPPQKVEQGIVEIRIAEGRLAQIQVTGNRWFSNEVLAKQIHLDPAKPIDYAGLRASLVRLNKHRDIEAKAIIKPGPTPQTANVEVQVKDKFPVHAAVDVNNLGTRNTGKTRWGQSLNFTNLTGHMDELSGRFQIGKGAYAVGADYNAPVGPKNTRLGFSFIRAAVDLGGDFKALDIEGDATTYGIYALQPFLTKEKFEATFKLGFDWKSVENRILDRVSGNDELRILNLGTNFEQTDSYGKTLSPHSFHFGFDRFLGASHKNDSRTTRTGTGGQFFIYRGSILRYMALPYDLGLLMRALVQLTPDKLVPTEQFRLGGAHSIRGYSEGEYLGDYGAMGSVETYVPTFFFPKDWKLPGSSEPLQQQVQGVAFFDFGGAGLRGPQPGEKADRFLTGAGGGVRVRLYKKIYARVEWAAPLGESPNDSTDSAFYFGVSAELL